MRVRLARRGPLIVYAHPDGARERVRQWARAAQRRGAVESPGRVLVVGGSAGLGLATRVVATVGGADTVAVCRAQPGTPDRPGTDGWYATAAVHELADAAGGTARTVIGDAFSDATKRAAAETCKSMGGVDLLVYSVASARRTHPDTGAVHRSAIRTLGEPLTDKSYDLRTGEVRRTTMEAATPEQVADTVAVMGGDDWQRWWQALGDAGALAPDARTVAFSYEGGPRLRPTYRGGTLGAAKDDLEETGRRMDRAAGGRGTARTAVMAALVTRSSAVIPMSALYWMLLARVLADAGTLEGPLEQAHRLLDGRDADLDEAGRLRLDRHELDPAVQREVERRWDLVETDNLAELGAPDEYLRELARCSGWAVEGIDYEADTDPVVPIEGVVEV